MIDFHCHLDLYKDPSSVVRECVKREIYLLSVTTTPSAWNGTLALAECAKRIRTAIGLHPQLAAERKHELPLFDEILPVTKYVGEIGLDGGEELRPTWPMQVEVFTHLLRACTKVGGRIMSIHSRRAATEVLDHLDKWRDCGTPILHWFSGTASELERAKKRGCWFSVGPAMLSSKKGRDLTKRMPQERVLTESDGPFALVRNIRLNPWDVEMAIGPLSEIWAIPKADVSARLLANLRCLTSASV